MREMRKGAPELSSFSKTAGFRKLPLVPKEHGIVATLDVTDVWCTLLNLFVSGVRMIFRGSGRC